MKTSPLRLSFSIAAAFNGERSSNVSSAARSLPIALALSTTSTSKLAPATGSSAIRLTPRCLIQARPLAATASVDRAAPPNATRKNASIAAVAARNEYDLNMDDYPLNSCRVA